MRFEHGVLDVGVPIARERVERRRIAERGRHAGCGGADLPRGVRHRAGQMRFRLVGLSRASAATARAGTCHDVAPAVRSAAASVFTFLTIALCCVQPAGTRSSARRTTVGDASSSAVSSAPQSCDVAATRDSGISIS